MRAVRVAVLLLLHAFGLVISSAAGGRSAASRGVSFDEFQGRGTAESVNGLVERVLGIPVAETPLLLEMTKEVPVRYQPKYEGKGFFLAYNHGSNVVITGSSGIDIAYGVGW